MKQLCGVLLVAAVVAAGCGEPAPEKKKTPGGVKFDVVKEGEGPEAKQGDWVQVHYTGKLSENGRQFDSSLGKGFDGKPKPPLAFRLGIGPVIAGWHEGINGMK